MRVGCICSRGHERVTAKYREKYIDIDACYLFGVAHVLIYAEVSMVFTLYFGGAFLSALYMSAALF